MNDDKELDEIIDVLEKVLKDHKQVEKENYERIVKLKERRQERKNDLY